MLLDCFNDGIATVSNKKLHTDVINVAGHNPAEKIYITHTKKATKNK